MEIEQAVARHYAHGSLEEDDTERARAAGKDLNHLTPKDLASGGRISRRRPARRRWRLPSNSACGRTCACSISAAGSAEQRAISPNEHGCQVSGIDLSEEYVNVANALAARVGLDDRVCLEFGSALALPFAPGSFDAAYMLHVGMNIEDKARLFAEVRRVLRRGHVRNLRRDAPRPGRTVVSGALGERARIELYRRRRELSALLEARRIRSARRNATGATSRSSVFEQMRARGAARAPRRSGCISSWGRTRRKRSRT